MENTLTDANTRTKLSQKQLKLMCLFAFYAFVFLLIEITVNNRAAVLWGQDKVIFVYAVGLLFTAAGYISFTFSQRWQTGERGRKLLLLLSGGLSVAGLAGLLLTDSFWSVAAGWLCLFVFGFVASAIYYYAACGFAGSPYTGRCIGVSMTAAVVCQYFTMNHLPFGQYSVMTVAVISLAVIGLLVWKPPAEWFFEEPLPYERNPAVFPREALWAVGMVFFMTLGFALSDECVTELDAKGMLNVASWPRLFYGAGLIAAGWLADYKRRRYLYMLTAAVFSLAILSAALLLPGLYNFSMSVMYFYSGFYVLFLTTAFFDLAPKTKEPYLWAGMGRIVRSVTTAIMVFPAERLMGAFGVYGVLGGNALAVMIVLWLSWYVNESKRQMETAALIEKKSLLAADAATVEANCKAEEDLRMARVLAVARLGVAQATAAKAMVALEEAESARDEMEKQLIRLQEGSDLRLGLKQFASLHELTPRESEVMELLLTKDATTKELAKELLISERVCQRYITAIFDKTGCSSRVGLLLFFYGQSVKKNVEGHSAG